jgi:hypothetical protein
MVVLFKAGSVKLIYDKKKRVTEGIDNSFTNRFYLCYH